MMIFLLSITKYPSKPSKTSKFNMFKSKDKKYISKAKWILLEDHKESLSILSEAIKISFGFSIISLIVGSVHFFLKLTVLICFLN